jgi:hypothetical protein
VESLDRFRRPADAREVERRRAGGLNAKQDAYLLRWGYPYVFDEYRFHITLTGRLDDGARERLIPFLEHTASPMAGVPVPVVDLCVVVEREANGDFTLLKRFPLRSHG